MSTAEKLAAIAANVPLVYAAGKAGCIAQHFVTKVKGDGSGTLQIKVPFVPDCVAVMGFEPYVVTHHGSVMVFVANVRSIANYAGMAMASREGTPYNAILRHVALDARYHCDEDGLITMYDLPCGTGTTDAVFCEGGEYVVIALKCIEQTDRERVIAFMQQLAGKNLTLTVSRKIVAGAFPGADEENAETGESMNEEWNALKRQYAAGCTIALT